MSKSSRLGWLHGMILLSAVIGCKSGSCGNGSCGPTHSGPPPVATGSSGYPMTGSGYAGKYGDTATPMYQGSSTGSGMYPGASTGSGPMAYPAPQTATSTYPGGLGSAH
jgi:hypothetical protein